MEEQGTDQPLSPGLFSETLHSVAVTEPTPQSGSKTVLAIIILAISSSARPASSVDHHLKRGSVYEKLVVMLSSQKARHTGQGHSISGFFPNLLLISHPGIYTSLYSCHCLAMVYRYSSYHLPIIIIPFSTPSLSSASITAPILSSLALGHRN